MNKKKWLKDICEVCKHERGKHNDNDDCSDCYEELEKDSNKSIKHEFILGVKNG